MGTVNDSIAARGVELFRLIRAARSRLIFRPINPGRKPLQFICGIWRPTITYSHARSAVAFSVRPFSRRILSTRSTRSISELWSTPVATTIVAVKPSEEFKQRRALNKERAFASMQNKLETHRLKNTERHLRKSGDYPRP